MSNESNRGNPYLPESLQKYFNLPKLSYETPTKKCTLCGEGGKDHYFYSGEVIQFGECDIKISIPLSDFKKEEAYVCLDCAKDLFKRLEDSCSRRQKKRNLPYD